MPRRPLIRTNLYPYHVTSRSNNREWFYLPSEELWPIFIKNLDETTRKFQLEIYSFVLMNNHFHLLVKTPMSNLDKAMQHFIHSLSLNIGTVSGRINRIFGGRYKWSLIQNQKHFFNVYRYIYQNPIRAGICSLVENYSYCSLNSSLQFQNPYLYDGLNDTDFFKTYGFSKQQERNDWLNNIFEHSESEKIRKGLHKTIFTPVSQRPYAS